MVYVDDILIYSHSELEHIDHFHMVFERLKQHGITLHREKCTIRFHQVPTLDKFFQGKACFQTQQKSKLFLSGSNQLMSRMFNSFWD